MVATVEFELGLDEIEPECVCFDISIEDYPLWNSDNSIWLYMDELNNENEKMQTGERGLSGKSNFEEFRPIDELVRDGLNTATIKKIGNTFTFIINGVTVKKINALNFDGQANFFSIWTCQDAHWGSIIIKNVKIKYSGEISEPFPTMF